MSAFSTTGLAGSVGALVVDLCSPNVHVNFEHLNDAAIPKHVHHTVSIIGSSDNLD